MRLSGPPVRMSSGFVPACLPEEPVAPGQVVAVVGWGRTWRRSQSKKLKVVRGNSIGNRHVSKKKTLIRLIWWKTGRMTALAKRICLNWDLRYCYFLCAKYFRLQPEIFLTLTARTLHLQLVSVKIKLGITSDKFRVTTHIFPIMQ